MSPKPGHHDALPLLCTCGQRVRPPSLAASTGAPAHPHMALRRRTRWRSTTNSRRRSCATTSSSTGAWAPSPPSSASITAPSSGCWARPGVERERRRPRRPSKLDPYMAFITETLDRFPTLTAARLFDMVKARGYPGGPDHFRHRIAPLRPHRPARSVSASSHPARRAGPGRLGALRKARRRAYRAPPDGIRPWD